VWCLGPQDSVPRPSPPTSIPDKYAGDTPYTQARTLGARGLAYRGIDATYAGAVAIVRRVFQREGLLR
jgi:hypothetical protein